MIESIEVKNFKCFAKETFSFKPLTLLTGTNSSGKSSLIQSILISGNHASGSDIIDHIHAMGNFDDLKNRYKNPQEYSIDIQFTDRTFNHTIGTKEYEGVRDGFISTHLTYPSSITYLNSNRITISERNTTNNSWVDGRYFGVDGKFIVHYYELFKDQPIEEYLIYNLDLPKTLEAQVDAWILEITEQSIRFQTEELSSTSIKAFYEIDGLDLKPNNIGTGISYLVAMLVACLSARQGNIIIVENPEIHLHPKAQSKLIDFFTFIANAGIQIILESHSDHIFNGVRKNIYLHEREDEENKSHIKSENVSIHYFDNEQITSIVLDETGNVRNHQSGLFDQFDDDLNVFLGLSWM